MIYDHISRIEAYRLPQEFITAVKHSQTVNASTECDGVVLSDALSVNIKLYDTVPVAAGKPETHRDFIDMQIVLSGKEFVGWYPEAADLEVAEAYNPERDITFYKQSPAAGYNLLRLEPGFFMIFFPWDVHMPMLSQHESISVKKLIYKINVKVY